MAEKHAFRLLLTWKNIHYNTVSRFMVAFMLKLNVESSDDDSDSKNK